MFLTNQHFRLVKRFFFLMIPYSLIRIGFYFYHLNVYKQFPQEEIFQSFLLGLRFDVAAICLLNSPIILLSLIPSKNTKFLKNERLLFVFLNFAGIVAALNDFELFLFMGKRLSFDFFVIGTDILQQLPQVFRYYWYLPLLAVAWAIGFYFFDKKAFRIKHEKLKLGWHLISSLLLLIISFLAIRGGLQHKSINVQTAFSQGKNELGHLVLNTPYHFMRTLKNKSQRRLNYFATDEEAINVIINRRDLRPVVSDEKMKNVVFIILESFSNEYVEKGLTPFLSELMLKGDSFPYHFANGRRSIEALPSLLCGLPSLLDEPISKSIFQSNKFVCMPQILKDHGYKNYFFHGGARGTMGFESYTMAHGFDRYFSKVDYPGKNDFDGTWGIFDGPYLNFVVDEIAKMPEPFLATVFTLSSHHPYSIPADLKGKFSKGSLEIHESVGYADFALKQFFEKAKTQPWFSNSIFIITSDHSQKLESRKYQNGIGRFRVPLIIYAPVGKLVGLNTDKVTQHSDIPKTVLDLVQVKSDKMPATSVSLLSGDSGYALNYADGQDYLLISRQEVIRLPKSGPQVRQDYDWDTGEFSATSSSEDPLLKAYLQYFINGLINNNLSLYR